jgi:hypothetical protein
MAWLAAATWDASGGKSNSIGEGGPDCFCRGGPGWGKKKGWNGEPFHPFEELGM